jgi:hypothetical protein
MELICSWNLRGHEGRIVRVDLKNIIKEMIGGGMEEGEAERDS